MQTIDRKGYRISAKAKSAEILIYDDIGEGWFGGISAKQFAEDIKKLPKVDEINVRINSAGGSVFEGEAMFNTLKRQEARIVVDIDGLAASIASIVAMAGDEINMAENAFFMIHDPWVMAMGNAEELRAQADLMDKVQNKLRDTYIGRTGIENSVIEEMMANETWMTAEEALEFGFIDNVTSELKMAASVKHPEIFKHMPDKLKPAATPRKDRVASNIGYINESLKAFNL